MTPFKPILGFWHQSPFTRLLLPLTIGIIFQLYFQIQNPLVWIGLMAGLLAISAVYRFLPVVTQYKFGWLTGLSLHLMVALLGWSLVWLNDFRNFTICYTNKLQGKEYVEAYLTEPPLIKPKSIKANASIEWLDKQRVQGNLVLYFKNNDQSRHLQYGDRILFSTSQLKSIRNSGNPYCFDYQRWCSYQNIYHQAWLDDHKWQKLPSNNGALFWKLIYGCRNNILSTLTTYIPGDIEQGVAEALLIGYRNDLDKDLQQSYANTGIVHILAISGMHLGMIMWALQYLLFFLDKNKTLRIVKSIIILSILWIFSLMTGASGSVMRACVMFSFIQIATFTQFQTSIFNTMSFSAFFLLAFNPFTLTDAGFQLSYLAVIGIVLLQRFFMSWLYFQNWPLQKIWELMAVSMAAQVAAFPICLYYFHQFPNYFLLANLAAIPLSTLILFGEIGLLVVPLVSHQLASWLGLAVGKGISLMNFFILQIDSWPGALIDGVGLTILQTALLYLGVAFTMAWLVNKWNKGLVLGLSVFGGLAFISLINAWQISHQQRLIVYAVPNHSAIDFIHQNKVVELADSEVASMPVLHNFHIKPARIGYEALQVDSAVQLKREIKLFAFQQRKIAWVNAFCKAEQMTTLEMADIIILGRKAKVYLTSMDKQLVGKQLVIDSSVPRNKAKRWVQDCLRLGIRYWNCQEQGAFVYQF